MLVVCENCQKVVEEEKTGGTNLVWSMDAGPTPAGSCPDCDCLCYYPKDRPDLDNALPMCDDCRKSIESSDDLFYFKDGDNFNANEEGYVTICFKCAKRLLLDSQGSPLAEIAKQVIDFMEKI
jgi:hypothetical protein